MYLLCPEINFQLIASVLKNKERKKKKKSFPDVSAVKDLPVKQETWVWFLGWEDPLEKAMTSYSSILAWEIPKTEEPCGLQSMGLKSQIWLNNNNRKKIKELIFFLK